jgi:hypothetical protein
MIVVMAARFASEDAGSQWDFRTVLLQLFPRTLVNTLALLALDRDFAGCNRWLNVDNHKMTECSNKATAAYQQRRAAVKVRRQ